MKKKPFVIAILALILLSLVIGPAFGQTEPEDEGSSDVLWTIVPGPFYNPNVGFGVLVMPMVMYSLDPEDEISPMSSTMLGLLWTKPDWSQKGSTWMGGINQQFYINEDTWRLSGYLAGGTILYRFFETGNEAGGSNAEAWIRQDGFAGNVMALRKIVSRLYGGVFYNFQAFKMYGRDPADQALLDLMGIPTDMQFVSSLGARLLWDSRDNQYAASEGVYAELNADYGAEWLGSSTNWGALALTYSQYAALTPNLRHILAWQGRVRTGFGDVPPNDMSSVGSDRSGYRGYLAGEYKDKSVFEAQLEYRPFFTKRFGAVAFAGVGNVFADITKFGQGTWLPAAGFGVRFAAIPEERVNARLDFAWGIDSFAIYFSLGEAF